MRSQRNLLIIFKKFVHGVERSHTPYEKSWKGSDKLMSITKYTGKNVLNFDCQPGYLTTNNMPYLSVFYDLGILCKLFKFWQTLYKVIFFKLKHDAYKNLYILVVLANIRNVSKINDDFHLQAKSL